MAHTSIGRVTHPRPTSRCSCQKEITFHWFDGIKRDPEPDPFDFVTNKLVECVNGPNRLHNPWADSMIESEFRLRLRKAAKGELVPVDEVKGVDEDNPEPIYEIRWCGLAVTERNPNNSQVTHLEVEVRLYHSEPEILPNYFIGHNAHEKIIAGGSDTYQLQDVEIEVARRLYQLGEAIQWNVA